MNIYIANFDTQWTNDNLKELFTPYGAVDAAQVMIDGFTERSRGFGYVEMPDEVQAGEAIAALDRLELDGKSLTVSKAAPRDKPQGSYKVGNSVNPYRFRKN